MTDPNIIIATLGGNCPVQGEGWIDGRPFYFRARGSHWSLEIGRGPLPMSADLHHWTAFWEYDERFGDWPDAGWMDESDAVWLIHRAAMLYRQDMRAL